MTLIMTEACENIPPVGWDAFNNLLLATTSDRYTADSAGLAFNPSSGGSGTTQWLWKKYASQASSTAIIGCAIKPTVTSGSVRVLFHIYNGDNSSVRMTAWLVPYTPNSSLAVEIRDGASIGGALRATTTIGVVDIAGWYFVEVKAVCHASTGSLEVRVNELTVASATGINTTGGIAGTDIGGVIWGISQTNGTAYAQWDDFYLCNGAGSTNNDFLGDVRILRLRPTSAGDSSGFTPGGAGADATNHYENVNNSAVSTMYNASGVDETTETYNYDSVPAAIVGTIFGVHQKTIASTSILNTGIAQVIKDSAAESEGSEFALATGTPSSGTTQPNLTYTVTRAVESKPSGGAWTPAEINAMQSGVRIKSIT